MTKKGETASKAVKCTLLIYCRLKGEKDSKVRNKQTIVLVISQGKLRMSKMALVLDSILGRKPIKTKGSKG